MSGDNPYGSNRAARRRKKAEDRKHAKKLQKLVNQVPPGYYLSKFEVVGSSSGEMPPAVITITQEEPK